jgi:DNA-binding GntR family transcriptional regulator
MLTVNSQPVGWSDDERSNLVTARELRVVPGLVELDRTSLRERAMDMLRRAVAAREIQPGARLIETELSTAMNISRGTLREALRQLEYEGLLEIGERGRLTVRSLSDAEVRDMFAVRAELEGLAAFSICGRADRHTSVAALQAALAALDAVSGSISGMVEADLAFHRLLCELAGNATLLRAWETLTGPIRLAILHAGPNRARANMSASRHQQLVDSIATGESRAARRAVIEHMGKAVDTLLGDTQDSSPEE